MQVDAYTDRPRTPVLSSTTDHRALRFQGSQVAVARLSTKTQHTSVYTRVAHTLTLTYDL